MATPTVSVLDALLGKHISDICDRKFTADGHNHCAHFVSHVMAYSFGYTCNFMGDGKPARGGSIRVQDLFEHSRSASKAEDSKLNCGLAFVTSAKNVDLEKHTMKNVPKKHVGIFIGEKVWHYSNSRRKVVSQTVDEYQKHYPTVSDCTVFLASFPL
jgi:hypothetical protein